MAWNVKEAVLMAVTGNPGTGAVTCGAAPSGYQALGAGDDGNAFDVEIYSCDSAGNRNGLWETQRDSTWTNSSTSLSRSAANVVDGSSGPGVLVNFSSGTQRVANVLPSARIKTYDADLVPPCCRLTAQSGTAVPTADQTAVTTLYVDPYGGNTVQLYYNSAWSAYTFSEQSVKLTDSAQTGTYTTGAKTITGLTSTAQLVRGMQVTSGSVVNSTIASIDSATQITLAAFPTGNGTATAVTFKLPASTAYDVFAVPTSLTAFQLQFGNAWTNATTRADAQGTQNGVYCNNAAINSSDSNTIAAKAGRYLGTIYTTTTAGQTEDSAANRFVWNYYNRRARKLLHTESTASWTYTGTAFRQANGSTSNQVTAVVGVVEDALSLRVDVFAQPSNTAASYAEVGIGVDSSTTNSADKTLVLQFVGTNLIMPCYSTLDYYPSAGYHAYEWLETSGAAGTATTYYSTTTSGKSGISGTVWG